MYEFKNKVWYSRLLSQETGILHGFSDRSIGNMALSRGERQVAVNNRRSFMKKINLDTESILEPKISHGTNLFTLTKDGNKKRHTDSSLKFPLEILGKGYDGIITNDKTKTLFLCVGDCAPVLFYDPVQEVIATSHAGLSGAVAGIARHTVKVMHQVFDVSNIDIKATIGPCVGKYDIAKSNMWNSVLSRYGARELLSESLFEEQGDKLFFDIPLCIKTDLIRVGVLPENIEVSELCTIKDSDHFFSHYGAGTKGLEQQKREGRFASAIKLVDMPSAK